MLHSWLLRPMTITLVECWKLFNPSPRNLSIREAMLLFVGLPNKKSFHGNSFVCKCVYKGIRFHHFIAMLLALMESRGRTLFMQSQWCLTHTPSAFLSRTTFALKSPITGFYHMLHTQSKWQLHSSHFSIGVYSSGWLVLFYLDDCSTRLLTKVQFSSFLLQPE